jgi:hypothetical protein
VVLLLLPLLLLLLRVALLLLMWSAAGVPLVALWVLAGPQLLLPPACLLVTAP